MMFVIDANILITPFRLYYPPSLAPGFWTWLERKFVSGEYILLDRVADEITAGNDYLSSWTKTLPTTQIDEMALTSLRLVNSHVAQMGCTTSAVNEYFRNRVADQFVIAYAHAHRQHVISLEAPQPNAKSRVLIPNVCDAMGIRHSQLFPWLHSQGLHLVEAN